MGANLWLNLLLLRKAARKEDTMETYTWLLLELGFKRERENKLSMC